MKKLIEELEAARDNADSIKEARVLQLAINIVKSYGPWIDVSEELPPRDEKTDDCSINVWVTDGKRRNIGFYDFAENVWVFGKSYGKVTQWTYIPEVPTL